MDVLNRCFQVSSGIKFPIQQPELVEQIEEKMARLTKELRGQFVEGATFEEAIEANITMLGYGR